jgi:hypothetical protein
LSRPYGPGVHSPKSEKPTCGTPPFVTLTQVIRTPPGTAFLADLQLGGPSRGCHAGWLRTQSPEGGDEDYYLRQLRDWKLSAEIELMRPQSMEVYARLCGWTLARAHARSGDHMAISAYLGSSTRFDNAIADFAETYADQNERDHAALAAAVSEGRVQAQSGV